MHGANMKISTRVFKVRSTRLDVSRDVFWKIACVFCKMILEMQVTRLIYDVNNLETKTKTEDKAQTHYECTGARFSSQTNLCEICFG